MLVKDFFSVVVSFKLQRYKTPLQVFFNIFEKFEFFLEICIMALKFLEQLYIRISLTGCYDQIDNR